MVLSLYQTIFFTGISYPLLLPQPVSSVVNYWICGGSRTLVTS